MPKRRNYSTEFKREAIAMANQPGITKAQVGRELGINPNMLGRWERELTQNGSKAFLGKGKARDEEMAFSDTSVIPVPAAAWLFGSALVGLAALRRKGASVA